MGRLTRTPRLVVRRKSFELRILSDRGNTVVDRGTMSGGQSGAALAAPGRNDGAAGAGPHPQTETMGTTATPIARLERALAHGKTPKPSEWSQFRYGAHTARIAGGAGRWQRPLWKRPSNGTGHRQTGQTDANPANASLAGRDLGGLRDVSASADTRSAEGPRCPADTPNNLANIADSLADATLRLLASRFASQFSLSYRSRQRSLVNLDAGGRW